MFSTLHLASINNCLLTPAYLASERQHPLLWQEPEPYALGLVVSRQTLGGIPTKVGRVQSLSRQLVHLRTDSSSSSSSSGGGGGVLMTP
jgi:hypothetical protein